MILQTQKNVFRYQGVVKNVFVLELKKRKNQTK